MGNLGIPEDTQELQHRGYQTTTLESQLSSGTTELSLRHRIQIYGFWVLIILALGAYMSFIYTSRENKKFFKSIIQQGNFYYESENEKGKVDGKVYDLVERVIQPPPPITPGKTLSSK